MRLFVIIIEGMTVRFTVLKNVANILDNDQTKQQPKEVKLLNKSQSTWLLFRLKMASNARPEPEINFGFRQSMFVAR